MKTVKQWVKHYDSKDNQAQSKTEVVDWLIKGTPMTEGYHLNVYVDPIIEALELEKGHHYLEVGCGSGLFLHEVERLVQSTVATDISKNMLDSLDCKGQKILCAAHELPFEGPTFNRILMYGVAVCFPSFNYFKLVAKHLYEILQEDGILIIGDVPFGNPDESDAHILYDCHAMIDFLDSLQSPYSLVVPHHLKRKLNARKDLIIYKDTLD